MQESSVASNDAHSRLMPVLSRSYQPARSDVPGSDHSWLWTSAASLIHAKGLKPPKLLHKVLIIQCKEDPRANKNALHTKSKSPWKQTPEPASLYFWAQWFLLQFHISNQNGQLVVFTDPPYVILPLVHSHMPIALGRFHSLFRKQINTVRGKTRLVMNANSSLWL